jgi:hypothetical protein
MTPNDARAEAFGLFEAGWLDAGIIDPTPEVRWQGKAEGDPPRSYFARVSMVQASTRQASFAEADGASKTKYDNRGHIIVQVFAPMNAEDAFYNGGLLAEKARDIFRRVETPSGMWFRNMRVNELPNDGEFFRWNVIIEYEFVETSA